MKRLCLTILVMLIPAVTMASLEQKVKNPYYGPFSGYPFYPYIYHFDEARIIPTGGEVSRVLNAINNASQRSKLAEEWLRNFEKYYTRNLEFQQNWIKLQEKHLQFQREIEQLQMEKLRLQAKIEELQVEKLRLEKEKLELQLKLEKLQK